MQTVRKKIGDHGWVCAEDHPGGLETGFFRDWKIFTWGVEARRLERPPRRRQVAVDVIGKELFAVIFGLVAYDPAGVCDAPEGAGVV